MVNNACEPTVNKKRKSMDIETPSDWKAKCHIAKAYLGLLQDLKREGKNSKPIVFLDFDECLFHKRDEQKFLQLLSEEDDVEVIEALLAKISNQKKKPMLYTRQLLEYLNEEGAKVHIVTWQSTPSPVIRLLKEHGLDHLVESVLCSKNVDRKDSNGQYIPLENGPGYKTESVTKGQIMLDHISGLCRKPDAILFADDVQEHVESVKDAFSGIDNIILSTVLVVNGQQ